MRRIIRAELHKVRVTRGLLAVPVAGVVIAVVGNVLLLVLGKPGDIADHLSGHGPLRFGPTNFGLLLVVFGVRLFGDEVQHHTLGRTLIRNPDRRAGFAGKVVVAVAVGVAFCLVVDAVVIAGTVVLVAARDLEMAYDIASTGALLGRVVVAMVLLSVLGVAVGAVVRNRTVALVAVVGWFALGEDLVGSLLHVTRFLPSAAVRNLVSGSGGSTTAAAALAVLALVTAAAVAGAGVALRRDIP